MLEDYENMTTLELVRALKARNGLSMLELHLLDKLESAMDEVMLLEQDIRRRERAAGEAE